MVQRVVVRCAELGISLVPYGAGSSVVGGATSAQGQVVLDFKRMNRVGGIDPKAQVVRAEAGVMGERLERQLVRAGFTQGHFPSSMYCTSVGGWIAARSAGQMSSRFGKIEDQVVGGRVVLGDGRCVQQGVLPGRFGALASLVGAEGTLGLWTEATMRIHPLPEARHFHGFWFPTLAAAFDASRAWLEAGISPSVIRIYDPLDTFLHKDAHGAHKAGDKGPSKLAWAGATFPRLLNRLGNTLAAGCRVILGLEGQRAIVDQELALVMQLASAFGMKDLGEEAGQHWWQRRYAVSYKQSNAMRAGVLPDTMEVACTWDALLPAYEAVCAAALRAGVSVLAHFSHLYLDGGSIYFTFAMPVRIGEEGYEQLWDAVLNAAVGAGANVSHHHGIGRLKASVLSRVRGGANAVHGEARAGMDPGRILNPRVLNVAPGESPSARPPARASVPAELAAASPEALVSDIESHLRAQGRTLGDAAALFAGRSVVDAVKAPGFWRLDPQLGVMEPLLLGLDGEVHGEAHALIPAPRAAEGPELHQRLLEHPVERVWLRSELVLSPRAMFFSLPEEAALALAQKGVQSGFLRNCRVRLLPGDPHWRVAVQVPGDARGAHYRRAFEAWTDAPKEEGDLPETSPLPGGAFFFRSDWGTLRSVLAQAEAQGAEVVLPWVDPVGVAGFIVAREGADEGLEALRASVASLEASEEAAPALPALPASGDERATDDLAPLKSTLPRAAAFQGALDNCTYCPKLCRFACPAAVAEGSEAAIPRQLLLSINLHRRGDRPLNASTAEQLWSCVDCGACTEYCDHGNPVASILREVRADLVESGEAPEGVASVLEHLGTEGSLPGAGTGILPCKELEGAGPGATTWLFLGCQGSVERPLHQHAALRLAQRVYGEVHVMRASSSCCGAPLRRWGGEGAFQSHAKAFLEQLAGVERLVVDEGGCAHAFERWYAEVGVKVPEIVTTTALLVKTGWELPDAGRFVPHDCCERPQGEPGLRQRLRGGERFAPGAVMEGERGSCGGMLSGHRDEAASRRMAEFCAEDLRGGGGERILVESPSCRAQLERAGADVDDLLEVWLDSDNNS
jgi:alkyldihydroxyacetonephosphate synthase